MAGILKATNSRVRRSTWIIIVSGVLLLLITGLAVYLFLQHSSQDLSDVNAVKQLVARHMLLPTDETPALVTVTDPSKLTTDFLKQTVAGDKVLIYQTNKRAIIYRPSVDRVVDVGPVLIDAPRK